MGKRTSFVKMLVLLMLTDLTLSAACFRSAEDKEDQGAVGNKAAYKIPCYRLSDKSERLAPYRSLVLCFRTHVHRRPFVFLCFAFLSRP